MKRYDAVVFDWDGTVMDSTHSIVASMQLACADVGLAVPPAEQARWVIGLSLESALYRAVPDLTAELLPQFLERYRTHYFARDGELRPFDGIFDVLGRLKTQGIALAVATGKSRKGLDRALDALQWHDLFDTTRCADESISKPHPAMLHEIMATLDLAPERILMVGDTTHDVQMAHSAGVDSMAVTYGAHDTRTLVQSEPTVMVSSVAQMQSWLMPRLQGG